MRIDGTAPPWEVMRDMLFTFKRMMRLDYVQGFACMKCQGRILVCDGVTFGPPKIFTDVDPLQADPEALAMPAVQRCVIVNHIFVLY